MFRGVLWGIRRDFIKGSAWMLGLAAMSGCMVDKISVGTSASKFPILRAAPGRAPSR